MAGYSKLWSTIVTSSVWSEDDKTRIMWITMLAVTESDGHVSGSIPGMAAVARLSIEDTETAIERLSSPDPYSRSLDFGGRRIAKAPGGWQILNYDKYRASRDEDQRKAYMREYMQNYRKQNCKQRKHDVNSCKPPLAQAEAEAEAKAVKEEKIIEPVKEKPKKRVRKKKGIELTTDEEIILNTFLVNLEALDFDTTDVDRAKWGIHVRRMLDINKFALADVLEVLEYIKTDRAKGDWPGWGSVVLSTLKLRDKFPAILAQMKARKNGKNQPPYETRPSFEGQTSAYGISIGPKPEKS